MKMISNTFRTGKTSIYTLMHYAQIVNQKTFAAYNWRVEDENIARYRITQPPKYMMTEVNVPCTIFWSEMDSIACYGDVQRLMEELQNLLPALPRSLPRLPKAGVQVWGGMPLLLAAERAASLLLSRRSGEEHRAPRNLS